ncbi:hypothetical protein AOQ84DRAFT_388302 [Glonium stellatum]|uniref:Uncharacterized protein n=1 Tax=Glonium stellatum TaxID=574774 RepID=A0A8E2F2D2_9PEZI|nr:hypothetical protein AOQ84DRAFT_388302 [Glonium stellatum]
MLFPPLGTVLAYTTVIVLALLPAIFAGWVSPKGVIKTVISGHILRVLMIPSHSSLKNASKKVPSANSYFLDFSILKKLS